VTRKLRILSIALVLTMGGALNIAPAQAYPESLLQEMHWRMIGPFRGGRTRAVAGVPSQPNVFYVGAVDGGVWKSNDYGRTWNPIFDGQPTQSIGAIAIPASNPNVIYVASGEGLQRPDLSVGDGIYKSADGGSTWTHLGLRDGQQIPALAVDPRDPNRLFAAVLGHPYGPNAERGIFRSTDGGATWQKILFKDENTGGSDVEIDPSNPDTVYACLWQSRLGPWEDNNYFAGTNGGLFKSTDGGNTWKKLTKGLPENLVQINVTIAQSQPNRLYATLSTTDPASYGSGKGLGFYRSDDAGESWTRITDDPRPAMKIGGGDLPVPKVDPKNPDVVYVASIVTMRSTDGGKTWVSLRGAPGGDDYQNLWINPENPSIILLVSDQGALVSVNRGESWSSWYNQPTAQLYHVSATNTFPYKVCGGQQESGSVCILSRGNDGEITFRDWHPVGVIEYGYVAPDPTDPDIIYGAGRNEVSRFHWSTGQVENVTPIPLRDGYRSDRTEPIMFSPIDPHLMYYAANVLFQTKDGGRTWQTISQDLTRGNSEVPASVGDQANLNPGAVKQRGAIYAVAPSFHNSNIIWAGTDDGLVWRTTDGGKNWQNVTPPELTPWSKVSQISASHFDDETAYVSVSRFRINDLHPYIYRTHDRGKTWEQITADLPDNSPVNSVREDSVRKGLLFAATETGVWVSFDDGGHWQSLQLNLPHTSMRDLLIHDNDLTVATHGRSFWILDDISRLRQLSAAVVNGAGPVLFAPSPAYRVRRDTNTDTPLPPDEPAGENPPDGAIIDYFLPESVSGPVTLEIADSQGKVVHRYASTDKPEQSSAELEKQLIPLYWLKPEKSLSASTGAHRWVWDMRYAPPASNEHEYPIAAVPNDTPRYPLGPLAIPGKYLVRLTAAGQVKTSELTVIMDPRVKVSLPDLEKQRDIATKLSSEITRGTQAANRARSIREQIGKLLPGAGPSLKASLEQLDGSISSLLEGAKDRESTPAAQISLSSVNANLLTIYRAIEQADAAPTAAQVDAATKSEASMEALLGRWSEIERKEISNVNDQLRLERLSPLQIDLPPEQQGGGEGEDAE
jgi:photosystem II stability/assembly factor-like uncharacterized protein